MKYIKNQNENRICQVNIRLTENEKIKLNKLAKKNKCSITQLIVSKIIANDDIRK